MSDHQTQLMFDSLTGLSVGDAFGEHFLSHIEDIPRRRVGDPVWGWTDDTEMAISIVSNLLTHRAIQQDELAREFLDRFDPRRRYGRAMLFQYFPRLRAGDRWRDVAYGLFYGEGSYGNGAAMRVAPLGAWFADDLDAVAKQARLSAEVTHAHAEGIAGTVAVAVAAAFAARQTKVRSITGPRSLIESVLPFVPESEVRQRLVLLYETVGPGAPIAHIAGLVGDGGLVSAQDTVPLCIWAAGRYLDNYEEALWQTVSVLGDMDTNCAIVGGIVAAHVGVAGIPARWLESRESIPSFEATADT
jgi:ADP-ribosylglycohydrolase